MFNRRTLALLGGLGGLALSKPAFADTAFTSFSFPGTSFPTSRTTPARIADTFNVKEFGALGNNSNDDTSAIQAAINAAGVSGGVVFFPPGTYKITSKLNCLSCSNQSAIKIIGSGDSAQNGQGTIIVGNFLDFLLDTSNTSVTFTGNINGTTTISGISAGDITAIGAGGQVVVGYGVPPPQPNQTADITISSVGASTVTLSSAAVQTLSGVKFTAFKTSAAQGCVSLIEGIQFQNSGNGSVGGGGICVTATIGMVIRNCTFSTNYFGIIASNEISGLVQNCNLIGGLASVGSGTTDGSTGICRMSVVSTRIQTYDTAASAGVQGMVIGPISIEECNTGVFANGDGLLVFGVQIEDCYLYGIYVIGSGIAVIGNWISGPDIHAKQNGIYLNNTNGVLIAGNNISSAAIVTGIDCSAPSGNNLAVLGNNVANCTTNWKVPTDYSSGTTDVFFGANGVTFPYPGVTFAKLPALNLANAGQSLYEGQIYECSDASVAASSNFAVLNFTGGGSNHITVKARNLGTTATAKIDNGSGGNGNVFNVTATPTATIIVGTVINDGTNVFRVSALGTGMGGTGTYTVQTLTGGAVSVNLANRAWSLNAWEIVG